MLTVVALALVLGLVVYRVERFVLEDSLLDQPRVWFKAKLLGCRTKDPEVLDRTYEDMRDGFEGVDPVSEWRMKLYELFDCHYCMGIHVAFWATLFTDWQMSVPLPAWVWVGSSAVALVVWEYVEE